MHLFCTGAYTAPHLCFSDTVPFYEMTDKFLTYDGGHTMRSHSRNSPEGPEDDTKEPGGSTIRKRWLNAKIARENTDSATGESIYARRVTSRAQ